MKVFFASDIHGSTSCFRKLVNAGAFYGVDVLLMGGDMAGKELVPLIERGSGWNANFRGAVHELDTREEAEEFERRVATVGPYTKRVTAEFVNELRDNQDLVESTLRELILERTEELVALASERLAGTGRQLLIGLGNDDFDEMIPLLEGDAVRHAPDGVIDLGPFSLASLGWSNPTPWKTNRECSEEELELRLDAMLANEDASRTVLNIHVPPYASGLDNAPRLNDDLKVMLVGGEPDFVPVGSTAVASMIAKFQPIASLHGHIHEGRGSTKIGRTYVVNPGSEYEQSSLLGALLDVRPGKKLRSQLVSG
jgi:Icc-related predicted phosphoesterase